MKEFKIGIIVGNSIKNITIKADRITRSDGRYIFGTKGRNAKGQTIWVAASSYPTERTILYNLDGFPV